MKKFTVVSAIAASAFLAINSFAGTLTPGPSPSPQPSFNPAGVVSANTIALQQTSPSVVKILGNATITPGAGASSVTLSLVGTFTANSADFASYAYFFNIQLNSNTPATFTLSLTANVTNPAPFTLSTSTGPQAIAANSNLPYSGRGQTSAAPLAGSGNFTAQLKIDFAAGTTATDKLILSIPSNSIDFSVAPVAIPEPSTYALLGAGLLGLLVISRRRLASSAV